LAWKLAQTSGVEVHAAPGNPGIAAVAKCHGGVEPLALAQTLGIGLTVVGPEAPLADGIVDRFRAAGLAIVGPTQAAARLESSKSFAKEFFRRASIPTARYRLAANHGEAVDAIKSFSLPVVLKADGLAAGKGVVIARTAEEAAEAAARLLAVAAPLVIEEFLVGEEVSFIALCDGERALPLEASQDHKTLLENGQGPNTGGMGAYADGRILTSAEQGRVMDEVIEPALNGMRADGCPFTGFLYAGLMMTASGPRVLEFNARLGDPETQALMHRMAGDFTGPLEEAAHGRLASSKLEWRAEPSVCVVLAAHGYPGKPRSGDRIEGVDQAPADVFHAGTRLGAKGLETAGGRVLGVTARGTTLSEAIAAAYRGVEAIRFEGMQYRRDIGAAGLKRWRA
jgi:phosphoribosylamine--glycine ligase